MANGKPVFDLDSPERTIQHGLIISQKKKLKEIYTDWYNCLKLNSNYHEGGKFLELGSGAGFIKEVMPEIITSDILPLPSCDLVLDCTKMPFEENYLDGIVMIDVFHHIQKVELFLGEVQRTLKPNGILAMSEPWYCNWSKFIYSNFHHEPFDTGGDWNIPELGPLSGANGALPWIVFHRDLDFFNSKFPQLKLKSIQYHTPIRYLLSGGVSHKQIVPNWIFDGFKFFDKHLASKSFHLFAFITIQKVI